MFTYPDFTTAGDPPDNLPGGAEKWNNNFARAALQSGARPLEWLINGNFQLWQRATSFADPGNVVTADRWRAVIGAGNSGSVSRQAHTLGDVPPEARYFCRVAKTAGAGAAPEMRHRIEGVRSLAGQTVTVSFWARAESARDLLCYFDQVFGTGGSPSGTVTSPSVTRTLTTSWVRYECTIAVPSIAGKTLGSGGDDYLSLKLAWATNANGNVDISCVQIDPGATAAPFRVVPFETDWLRASRYYWKTYAPDTLPAAATEIGAVEAGLDNVSAAVHNVRVTVRPPVPMFKIPTLVFYKVDGTPAAWDGAASVYAVGTGQTAVSLEAVTASGTEARIRGHLVMDAEIG